MDPVARTGPEAMAVDEWLLETSLVPILRVYQWSGQWGSLGYFGKIDEARSLVPDVDWVRRWTGGGLVDHREDWTYTLFAPLTESVARLKGVESYRQIHAALRVALSDEGCSATLSDGESRNGGSMCFQNPVRHDILGDDREKLAGAGQRRNQKGLLHQGSVAGRCGPSTSRYRSNAFARALCEGFQEVEMAPSSPWIHDKMLSRYAQASWTLRR